jgi:hypothetical protein
MKIRMLMPVLTVLLVFGLANTAFAQLSCQVASTPVSRDTDTGHTEVVGDLIFNCIAGTTATTTATITVDYGVTITNNTAYPAGKTISVTNTSGSFANATPVNMVPSIAGVNNATGQIVINIPNQTAPANGSFTLTGVLASLNASGKTTLVANVSVSPGNNVLIQAGQNNATVITSILPGILAPIITPNTSVGSLLSSIPVNPASVGFSTRIRENYIDMYRSAAQYNGGFSTNGVQLLLTFAGIPTGVTLSGCSVTTTSGAVTPTFSSGSGTNITSTNNTVNLEWTTGPSLTAIDDVIFACTTVTAGSSATIPLTPGAITMTATLAPTGAALGSGNAVLTSATAGQIPRYANNPLPSPPLTVINITAAQTNFLIPFVVAETGFDTGIAIANTTTDPFGTTNGARPQSGNIQFNIFPRVGASCVVTPSSSTVGVGLTSAGILESGRTYTVLLSELLKVSGSNCPTTATGYIIGVASFPLGHGSSFVTDFKAFTSYSPVLILPPPALSVCGAGGTSTCARSALTFEALNN